MKKAREDPHERLSTDTTTPKMIDASNRPGNNKNRSSLIFSHFMTSAETDDKLSHALRSTLKVGFRQARACHLVLNPLHLKKLNFRKKSNIFTLTQLAALKFSNPKRNL